MPSGIRSSRTVTFCIARCRRLPGGREIYNVRTHCVHPLMPVASIGALHFRSGPDIGGYPSLARGARPGRTADPTVREIVGVSRVAWTDAAGAEAHAALISGSWTAPSI